jgi:uncharacterized membrane protein YfcA
MKLLQVFPPGRADFARPYHSYLPDTFGIFFTFLIVIIALYIYFSLRKKKKKGLSQKEIEMNAIKELLKK